MPRQSVGDHVQCRNPYNIIVIMLDSLRRDHLGCYGNPWIHTPAIDDLAGRALIFDNAYPEALPTIPVRTSLFTGQRTLSYRPWQALTKEDVTIAEILHRMGYYCTLITDTYHLFKPGMNFHKGFDSFDWIRGQEGDAWKSAPHNKNIDDFIKPEMYGDRVVRSLEQYLRNTRDRKTIDDYFAAQVFHRASQWLSDNYDYRQPFFLWVDSFDPHEPWDPPAPYDVLYTDPNYRGKKLLHPKYGPTDWMTEDELQYVRGLYAGEVSFVDHCVGQFLKTIRETGADKNTIIVLLADHGHPHGDHGTIMKTPEALYSELVRIPLLIVHPEEKPASDRVSALVQTHDILPTLLDFLTDQSEIGSFHGKSLRPLWVDPSVRLRDVVVAGYHASGHRTVRTEEWSYIYRPSQQHELYNLLNDPKEKTNVIEEFPNIAEHLQQHLYPYYLA
jgi:arylsulfatase A-like enzyme